MSIAETKPGSALDDQLRREQAKAVFDLLIATRCIGPKENDR